MKEYWKKIAVGAGIVALFLALSYGFVPQVLEGKIVNQSDISGYIGMSHEMNEWNKAHPDNPTYWTDSMFGGMPTTAISTQNGGDWTQPIYDLLLIGKRPATYLFIALLGAFLLMLAFGVSLPVAVGGAIAIAFCSYNFQIIQVGHNTKMQAIAFMPWVLAAVVFTYRSAFRRKEASPDAFARTGSRSDASGEASAPVWKDKIVIDVCSTKEQICLATHYHPCRRQFVSTHPMAGTEYSGPWAAMPGLFDGRACIFANAEESAPKAVKTIEELYDVLNMRPIYMNAANHDVHTAYVSHISHVTSFALALTVLDKEKDENHIFDLASGGFSSTVRLAKSSADMWVPILTQNRDNVLHVMDTYIEKMKAFREAVANYDEDRIRALIEEANRIKKIIR